jgi:hypothetical protein
MVKTYIRIVFPAPAAVSCLLAKLLIKQKEIARTFCMKPQCSILLVLPCLVAIIGKDPTSGPRQVKFDCIVMIYARINTSKPLKHFSASLGYFKRLGNRFEDTNNHQEAIILVHVPVT